MITAMELRKHKKSAQGNLKRSKTGAEFLKVLETPVFARSKNFKKSFDRQEEQITYPWEDRELVQSVSKPY